MEFASLALACGHAVNGMAEFSKDDDGLMVVCPEGCGLQSFVIEPDEKETTPLGWHVISGEHLLEVLRRANTGESADLLFAELWANADHERSDEDA